MNCILFLFQRSARVFTRPQVKPSVAKLAGGKRFVRPAWLLLLATFLLGAGQATAQVPPLGVSHVLHGDVIRVNDGDTLRWRGLNGRYYTIRLASIDAPETGNRERPGQPFAQVSRRALEDRVLGRRLEARCYEVDGYGRDVCDVLLPEGGTASQSLVDAGLAWANQQFDGKYLREPGLLAREARARAAGQGLWVSSQAMAPWVWRQRCWRDGQC